MPSPFLSPFRPVGNPEAVLAAARKCLELSQTADGLDAAIAKSLPKSAFEGEGRPDIDAKIRQASLHAGRGASDLLSLAKALSDGAAALERKQKAWDDAQDEWDRAVKREASGRAG